MFKCRECGIRYSDRYCGEDDTSICINCERNGLETIICPHCGNPKAVIRYNDEHSGEKFFREEHRKIAGFICCSKCGYIK